MTVCVTAEVMVAFFIVEIVEAMWALHGDGSISGFWHNASKRGNSGVFELHRSGSAAIRACVDSIDFPALRSSSVWIRVMNSLILSSGCCVASFAVAPSTSSRHVYSIRILLQEALTLKENNKIYCVLQDVFDWTVD